MPISCDFWATVRSAVASVGLHLLPFSITRCRRRMIGEEITRSTWYCTPTTLSLHARDTVDVMSLWSYSTVTSRLPTDVAMTLMHFGFRSRDRTTWHGVAQTETYKSSRRGGLMQWLV